MAKYPEDVAKKIADLEAQIEILKGENSRTLISSAKSRELAKKTCYYNSNIKSLLSRLLRSIPAGPSAKDNGYNAPKIKRVDELTNQEFLVLRNASDKILDILIECAEEVQK